MCEGNQVISVTDPVQGTAPTKLYYDKKEGCPGEEPDMEHQSCGELQASWSWA